MAPQKPSSRSSTGSKTSQASVGIGTAQPLPTGPVKLDPKYIMLRPHNSGVERNRPTYDCVMFMLYCVEHDKIAVSNVDNDVYWFPFVTREGRTWGKAIHEGLQCLLDRKDADGSMMRAAKLDANQYKMELFRLQSADLSWSQRMTNLVSLRTCSKTCEPANNLIWLPASELIAKCDKIFWGPEFQQHFTRFR